MANPLASMSTQQKVLLAGGVGLAGLFLLGGFGKKKAGAGTGGALGIVDVRRPTDDINAPAGVRQQVPNITQNFAFPGGNNRTNPPGTGGGFVPPPVDSGGGGFDPGFVDPGMPPDAGGGLPSVLKSRKKKKQQQRANQANRQKQRASSRGAKARGGGGGKARTGGGGRTIGSATVLDGLSRARARAAVGKPGASGARSAPHAQSPMPRAVALPKPKKQSPAKRAVQRTASVLNVGRKPSSPPKVVKRSSPASRQTIVASGPGVQRIQAVSNTGRGRRR